MAVAVIAGWCNVRSMVGGYLAVFVGAGLGGMLRHAVNRASLVYFGPAFPYGTLFVNIAGGLLMGVMAELFLVKGGGSQEFRLFLTTGFLGGFTTFSAFSLEAALMWQRSDFAALGSYVTASVLLSVAGLFLGMAAVRTLT
ncbi:fluoride efflux transporter CrcB [Sphingomonas sp.]|uniref:fluoride efflux transporter CrcB n=1 Tax=Sphingomonas sp. TaxID=28214 RepID=UPI0025D4D8FB|nr:fluoride efflux transporter CrcB [Sphingomonas sp.]